MSEMNQDEFADLEADLDAGLSLDDESLFAELDNEVILGDAAPEESDSNLKIDDGGLDDLDLQI